MVRVHDDRAFPSIGAPCLSYSELPDSASLPLDAVAPRQAIGALLAPHFRQRIFRYIAGDGRLVKDLSEPS